MIDSSMIDDGVRGRKGALISTEFDADTLGSASPVIGCKVFFGSKVNFKSLR